MEVKKATQRDRDYFRRLGEFEREGREEWRAWWRALPLHERLERSAARRFGEPVSERRDPEEPERIYERAKRLGIYRGYARLY
ncbi:MAG: hypothetical protein ACKVVT_06695 [Dehalococcoidia bacterium]